MISVDFDFVSIGTEFTDLDGYVSVAKPVNGLTRKHNAEEIQRIKDLNK